MAGMGAGFESVSLAPTDEAVDKIEDATRAVVAGLETEIQGSPEQAVIVGLSTLSAVQVIFSRYGIETDLIDGLYGKVWAEVIDRILAG